MPFAESKNTVSPSRIEPPCGTSRPATARNKVVLPLPDGPSKATTLPGGIVTDTPLRMSRPPRRSWMSLTTSSAMQTYSEPEGQSEADTDHDNVDDGQCGDEVDGAGAPQRHQQRADHLGSRPEQINSGRIFPHENEKDQHPACEHAVADE